MKKNNCAEQNIRTIQEFNDFPHVVIPDYCNLNIKRIRFIFSFYFPFSPSVQNICPCISRSALPIALCFRRRTLLNR